MMTTSITSSRSQFDSKRISDGGVHGGRPHGRPFIDDEWSSEDLIETSLGETLDGDISPCWLRQEGCNRPFGVVFRICKASDQAVEVTALHRMIRNSGADYKDSPFLKTGFDEVDCPAWDVNAPGRALDADGVAPNTTNMTWRY